MQQPLVEVVSYNTHWKELFEIEAKMIRQALGSNCIAVHHIGSTSVPGLSAKPIIDILPVVKDILEVDRVSKAMEALGYEVKGEQGMAFRRFFQKGQTIRSHNVHVYQEKDPEIDRYLKFRDWMRSHDEDAKNYAQLKIELALKFPEDISRYCLGKDAFASMIDAKTGFDGRRVVQALTDREWGCVHSLGQNHSPLKNKNHIHFVFYKTAEIIGYAHLELEDSSKALLHLIAIEKNHQHFGFGTQFLKICERWLSHQGIKYLSVYPSDKFHAFYLRQGFLETGKKNASKNKMEKQISISTEILH